MSLFKKNRKKIYLHIGSSKCGSSSIQYFLSQNKNLKNNIGEKMDYMSIIPPGKVIEQPEIFEQSQIAVRNFINSNFYARPNMLPKDLIRTISPSMRKELHDKKNCIFSSEAWLRSFKNEDNLNSVLNLFNEKFTCDIEMLAVVRSPASWINSAWWQWGVWDKNINSFDEWLEKAIVMSNWFNYLSSYCNNPVIKKLRIITLDKNLINKLIEFLNLEKRDDYKNKIINFSLNKNFIKALLSVPDYRLAKHKERDFFLYNRLVKTFKDYSPSTPWVLNENHLNRIFEKTEKANLKLLNLLNSETKSSIMNNSEWWDLSAFSNKVASDPYLNDYSLDKDLVSLIYQLFESNKKGIDFIASKALQKEFFNFF